MFANQQFTIDEMHNYRMAVTEREVTLPMARQPLQVINGCISQTNSDVRDHVIIYTRILHVTPALPTIFCLEY